MTIQAHTETNRGYLQPHRRRHPRAQGGRLEDNRLKNVVGSFQCFVCEPFKWFSLGLHLREDSIQVVIRVLRMFWMACHVVA